MDAEMNIKTIKLSFIGNELMKGIEATPSAEEITRELAGLSCSKSIMIAQRAMMAAVAIGITNYLAPKDPLVSLMAPQINQRCVDNMGESLKDTLPEELDQIVSLVARTWNVACPMIIAPGIEGIKRLRALAGAWDKIMLDSLPADERVLLQLHRAVRGVPQLG